MINRVSVIEHDLALRGKSDFLFRTVFAFLRASAKVRKDIVHLSLPLPSLRSVQGLGKGEMNFFLHMSRFPAGVSRLRTKSESIDIIDSSLYFFSDLFDLVARFI